MAAAHAFAGGAGGMLALSILYPLDNLRTRCQVEQDSLPGYESAQNESALTLTVDELLSLIKRTKTRDGVDRVLNALPGLQAALEHQRDSLHRFAAHPDAFPEIKHQLSPHAWNERSTWKIVMDVLKTEGIAGFYKGLTSGLVGMGAAWSTYYFCYIKFQKQALIFSRSHRISELSNLANLLIGAAAGTVACVITNPLWVVNTRIKLKKEPSSGFIPELVALLRDEGLRGAFQGLIPALVLVSNPAVQFSTKEYLQTLVARTWRHYDRDQLPVVIHFWIGALSKMVATVVTYPYQVLKTRLQRQENADIPVGQCIWTIFREEGLRGFYKGMGLKIGQTVMTSACMFAFYDTILRWILRMKA